MICERKAQSVGASICVYGVFGAYFAFFIIKWVETDNMFQMVYWEAYFQ